MFFRREKPKVQTFENRLARLKELGFKVENQGSGKARASKLGCAALLEDRGADAVAAGKVGILVGNEIAVMENGGYQMFFRTPSGRRIPALAEHLKALHACQEDLKEGLGAVSLYNTSLGTISDRHMYDRVKDREANQPKKPWEVQIQEV